MSQVNSLEVKTRTKLGTRASRVLRSEGIVPANLYGHNEESQALQVCGVAVRTVINSGNRLVDLVVDGKPEKALLSDVSWDTFGQHVLHVDFQRVDATEKVHVAVPVLLKGTAPGVTIGGGILEQPHHEVNVECLATNIPHEIVIRIHALELGQFVHVSELTDVPEGVTVLDPPDTILVHIAQPRTAEPEPEAAAEPVAPEVVGKKVEDEKAK